MSRATSSPTNSPPLGYERSLRQNNGKRNSISATAEFYNSPLATQPSSNIVFPAQAHLPNSPAFMLEDPFSNSSSRPSSMNKDSRLRKNSQTSIKHVQKSLAVSKSDKLAIMAGHLTKVAEGQGWFIKDASVVNGIGIRLAKNEYVMSPAHDARLQTFEEALKHLNCEVAITLTSTVVQSVTRALSEEADVLNLSANDQIQVVDTMPDLATARKAQYACFIRLENTLVVWSDAVDTLEEKVAGLERKLVNFVWNSESEDPFNDPYGFSVAPSMASSMHQISRPGSLVINNKEKFAEDQVELRPTIYWIPVYRGVAVALNLVICALFVRSLVYEALIDQHYTRLALLVVVPFQAAVFLFVADNIICAFAQMFLPIHHMHSNSLYYSGAKPKPLPASAELPHITVMMPVYKESLEDVLRPTIVSLQAAVSTYERQGGTANIIVCEDGLQLLDEAEQEKRRDYYDRQAIGFCARPKHSPDYIRKGRFKKSSNMNVTLNLSARIEELMSASRPKTGLESVTWNATTEDILYSHCLQEALDESDNKLWASGNLRIGDYILLVDSDNRVPTDSFLDAAYEMEQSPEVGILQHCNHVFLAGAGFFETGIAFFTRLVNFSISWSIASGSTGVFMGHSAFLRYRALQEQAFVDPDDGIRKIWSEDHVSEDFVMSMRLVAAGYILRWATYAGDGYQEGVSLSAADELNRWQNLVRWYRGPFSALFREYLWTEAPQHAKFSNISYILSYWAMACGWSLTCALFFVQGWFGDQTDPAWLPPFGILVGTIAVFIVLGNIAQIISRYRAREDHIFRIIKSHVVWCPFFIIFFGGLSYSVMTALLAHMFSYNMQWSTTVKDVTRSTVFKELPLVFKRFWFMLCLCGAMIVLVVLLSLPNLLPVQWQITGFDIQFPAILVCSLHILFPIVLNPEIVLFSF